MTAANNSIHALLVEDNPGDVRLIREMLGEAKGRPIVLEQQSTLAEGLEALSNDHFDVLLLDLNLPDNRGFDTFIKVHTLNPEVPIVILTGTKDEELAMKSLHTGAQDYLMKGQIDGALLSRSISYAIERVGLLKIVQRELVERKSIEKTLRKSNRALHMLSKCNEIVVRATDECILIDQICRAITEIGEYHLAWAGITQKDTGISIRPIAMVGLEKEYFQSAAAASWLDQKPGSILCEALETGQVIVCDDIATDERFSTVTAKAENVGYRSFVVLPLVTDGHTLGLIQICSIEANRFDSEELKLLQELKEDVTYAIKSIRTQKERLQAEERIKILARFPAENPYPVLRVALDGTLIYSNQASEPFLAMWKIQAGNVMPADLKRWITEAFDYGRHKEVEIRSGDRIFSFILAAIKDEGYVNMYGRDITERKKAEANIQQDYSTLTGIINSTDAAIFSLDASYRYTSYNAVHSAVMKALYGVDIELGKSIYDYQIVPEDAAKSKANIDRALRGEHFTEEAISGDGAHSRRYFEVAHNPICNAEGQVIGVAVFAQDITERKRSEEELRKNRELLNSIFETSRDGIFLEDETETIVFVNSACAHLFGYDNPQELVGKNVSVAVAPEDNDRLLEFGRRRLREETATLLYEFKGRRKDGTLIDLEISVATAEIDGKKKIISSVRDIRERKKSEEQKRQLERQLIQAQKIESIGTLASGIAHDFNNILGIILGHVSLLDRTSNDPTILSNGVDAISKAVQRGASLVRQILTFARKADTSTVPTSVNETITELSKMLGQTFPKTIDIKLELGRKLPIIVVDQTQLHQALLNLCVNARDAMIDPSPNSPRRGTLTIKTEVAEGAVVQRRFPEASPHPYICISVSDTGTGIDEATQQRIFEPFFTTKEQGKGTGMGLSVVYGVVRAHNGYVDVESLVGRGTTFKLYMPIPDEISRPVETKMSNHTQIRGGTETILLVEDEESLMSLMKSVLEAKGYTVLTATDGMSAVKIYTDQKEKIALVLSDMGLPRLSGAAVFTTLKEINPAVIVLLASGYLEPIAKTELLNSGVREFIQKPYEPREVLKKVREVLDGDRAD